MLMRRYACFYLDHALPPPHSRLLWLLDPRAERNRPTPNQSYHRGGAGEHTLEALHLQIGSVGDGGQPLRPEYDSEASCNVSDMLPQYARDVLTHMLFTDAHMVIWCNKECSGGCGCTGSV